MTQLETRNQACPPELRKAKMIIEMSLNENQLQALTETLKARTNIFSHTSLGIPPFQGSYCLARIVKCTGKQIQVDDYYPIYSAEFKYLVKLEFPERIILPGGTVSENRIMLSAILRVLRAVNIFPDDL